MKRKAFCLGVPYNNSNIPDGKDGLRRLLVAA